MEKQNSEMTHEDVTISAKISALLAKFQDALEEKMLLRCQNSIKTIFKCEKETLDQDVRKLLQDEFIMKNPKKSADESIRLCCQVCKTFTNVSLDFSKNNAQRIKTESETTEKQQDWLVFGPVYVKGNYEDNSQNQDIDLTLYENSLPVFEIIKTEPFEIDSDTTNYNSSPKFIDVPMKTDDTDATSSNQETNSFFEIPQSEIKIINCFSAAVPLRSNLRKPKKNSSGRSKKNMGKRCKSEIPTVPVPTLEATQCSSVNTKAVKTVRSRKGRSTPNSNSLNGLDLNVQETLIKNEGFKCTFCGQNFGSKMNLVVHIRNHSSERPYMCEHCNETFKFDSSLSRHIKTCQVSRPGQAHKVVLAPFKYGINCHKLKIG